MTRHDDPRTRANEAAPPAAAVRPLKIVSWNAHLHNGDQVAGIDALLAREPDLLMFQELMPASLDHLASMKGASFGSCVDFVEKDIRSYLGLFAPRMSGRIELVRTPDKERRSLLARIKGWEECVEAMVFRPDDMGDIALANIHTTCAASPKTRYMEVARAAIAMRRHAAAFIAGDMNNFCQFPLNALVNPLFSDRPWRLFDSDTYCLQRFRRRHGFRDAKTRRHTHVPSFLRLDYGWCRGDISVEARRVDDRYGSDHYPIEYDLKPLAG